MTRGWGICMGLLGCWALLLGAAVAPAAESSPQGDCVRTVLAKPKIVRAEVDRPGDPKRQTIYTTAEVPPISEACLQLVKRRTPTVTFEIQNPDRHGQWIKIGAAHGLMGSDGPIGDEGGLGEAYFSPVLDVADKRFLYRCTPGKRVTHVRAIYRTEVDSRSTGQVLGRASFEVPLRVRPARGPIESNKGAVRGAC